jgi:glycerol-3-phosphate dehydrogenase (NAD(P)+)
MATAPAPTPVAILGAGSWGTALAILLARNGFHSLLWGHDPARVAQMARERRNQRYLPTVSFPDLLEPSEDLSQILDQARRFLLVVPSHAFRSTLSVLRPRLSRDAVVAWNPVAPSCCPRWLRRSWVATSPPV